MTGYQRDEVTADIAHGLPTLSPDADALVTMISRLLTFEERAAFARELQTRVAASPAVSVWIQQPDQYLADFDDSLVAEITAALEPRVAELRQRAAERGWEVPQ
jgi:hypothetical protein